MTPERRAEIEKIMNAYERRQPYIVHPKQGLRLPEQLPSAAPAIIRELIAEIDRINPAVISPADGLICSSCGHGTYVMDADIRILSDSRIAWQCPLCHERVAQPCDIVPVAEPSYSSVG